MKVFSKADIWDSFSLLSGQITMFSDNSLTMVQKTGVVKPLLKFLEKNSIGLIRPNNVFAPFFVRY